MASDVTVNKALGFAQNTTNASAQLAEDFNQFLTLLTTQLQNQDPLDPASSTEFTNQLVAFAGVEQQINANQRLESLVSLNLGTSFSAALNYVGKDVSYLSSETYFDGQTPVDINYSIDGVSVDTTINIFSEDGILIRSEKISDDDNIENYTWDGKDKNGILQPEGTYSIRIDAIDGQNAPLTTTTVVNGHVSGIETQNGTTFLLVGDRAISIGNVINVKESQETQNQNNAGGNA